VETGRVEGGNRDNFRRRIKTWRSREKDSLDIQMVLNIRWNKETKLKSDCNKSGLQRFVGKEENDKWPFKETIRQIQVDVLENKVNCHGKQIRGREIKKKWKD
jgi:hypothetical protein